jgi:hypothetical protein
MDKKTVTLQFFMKTGGPQPETWDPEAINKFFIGNYAKQWAMGLSLIVNKVLLPMLTTPNTTILLSFFNRRIRSCDERSNETKLLYFNSKSPLDLSYTLPPIMYKTTPMIIIAVILKRFNSYYIHD